MAVTQTPRLKLAKQALGDAAWHTGLNQGFDDADLRLVTTGAASPVGVAEGFFVGAFYVQTTPLKLWVCTVVGTPGTWADVIGSGGEIAAALILANTIPLQAKDNGGTARNLAVMSAANKVLLGALTNLLTLQTSTATALKVDYGSGEQTIWHAGNDGAGSTLDSDTVDGVQGADIMAFTGANYFSTGLQTIVQPALQTFPHGFAAMPRKMAAFLHCAAAEHGFAIGDKIPLSISPGIVSGDANWVSYLVLYYNATNLYYRIPHGSLAIPASNGAMTGITLGNWRMQLEAWK